MKIYLGILILAAIVSLVFLTSQITGNIVYEKDPCRIIDCYTPIFGYWQTKAELINITKDGYAICHCPHERPEVLYYISVVRKY